MNDNGRKREENLTVSFVIVIRGSSAQYLRWHPPAQEKNLSLPCATIDLVIIVVVVRDS